MLLVRLATTAQSGDELVFASLQTCGGDGGKHQFQQEAIVQQFGRRLLTDG